MSVQASASSSYAPHSRASAGPPGVPGGSVSSSSATIQRDINRLFSSHDHPSRPTAASRHSSSTSSSYNSKPKENLHSLPTQTLQDRLQSQRQLLASLDAGLLSLPDNGQRIRDTIAAIQAILSSRSSPPSAADREDDALVKRMQAVSLASPAAPPKKPASSSRFHTHRMHVLSDDVATQVLTQARELEKKRNMQAALARLREGTAKFHASPPSWARPAMSMSSASASGGKPTQRAASASPVASPSDRAQQQHHLSTAIDNGSDSDWDTDSEDDQDDFLDGLDLGYDAFSDADDDGDTALGRMNASGSGMDADSDEDGDGDGDSGYQYRQ